MIVLGVQTGRRLVYCNNDLQYFFLEHYLLAAATPTGKSD